MQLTSTDLCLELNRAEVVFAVNSTGLCFDLNRAGLGRVFNRYRFVFGSELKRSGA